MDKEARKVIAEVQCYSVDGRGYYSDLHEFNFLATLDLNAPLEKSLAESADPGLEFGAPSFEFKCYTGNFLGEHIDLKQKPWQLEYIVQSLKDEKNATFYLCKEDLFCKKPITVRRKRSVVLSRRPSGMAQDFLKKTCGSVSGYESGYISDTHGVGTASPTSDLAEEKDSIFLESPPHINFRTRPPRPMSVHPSPSVPLRYQKHTAARKTVRLSIEEEETPEVSDGAAVLSHAKSLPSLFHDNVPHQTGTKSPTMQSPEKAKLKSMTLHHPSNHQGKLEKQRAHTSVDLSLPPWNVAGPTISSPVHRSPEPSPSPEYRLRRANALKRRSMFDLGIIHSTLDISFSPIFVQCHLKGLNVQGNKVSGVSTDGILTLQITISNYMTVQELKEIICSEIRNQTNVKDLLSSSLVVYYSDNGKQYELLLEQQFMFNTYFHRLSEAASDKTPPERGPMLQVRLASLLPAKELRVLYRISHLTGVLLEKDVHTQGVDTSHLTVLPTCDQKELQNARRTLHSYMQKVVRERDEQAYCSCRDIASREASVQLSLMTPTDNTIPIIFHYKTEFSLTRSLSIHSFADNALRSVFPALVVCGLVRDKLEDYTLQVTGEESFIYGEIELIAFRHIRKCIVKSEPIHLSVTEKPPVEVERPHQFSWLSVDPYSITAMNHSELSSCPPICQKDVCSAWEINQKLRLSKIHIEGVPQLPSKGASVHLELQLLHGSSELCGCIESSNKIASYYLTWTENMEFDIEIRNIPKAARIMTKVVSGDKLLFWGLVSVFDPSGRLRTGDSELRLWKGEQVKGTPDSVIPPNYCTHPANNSYHNAVRLNVTFPKIQKEPILYPSTKKDSRTVLKRQHPSISYPIKRQFQRMLDMIKKNKLYKSLPHYIKTSHWNELGGMLELFHALDELQEGIEDVPDYVALNLLDSDFPDEHVRSFAVKALEHLPDEQLEDYLLQLVQALKFEANHDSKLARFLLKKALTSRTIGHFFFWYLKSEMHNRLHMARFAVILEAYLKGCGEAMLTKFTDQVDIQNSLCNMAVKLRRECDNGRDLEKMQSLLPLYLQQLESPRFFFIPVHNPRNILGKLKPQRCKVMSSAKRPMWLEMYNIHPSALRQTPIRLILKLGDDLRQDMITLRMFSLFEKLWQEQGLDLELIPYGCMATSPYTGFIEVVKNARTIKEVSSVTNSTKLFEWIKSHQKNEFGETDQEMLDAAIKRFTRSCAGYSVATYVLGIGDRHNDNIMVTTSGNLFHIDFGHFLGHIKYFMGFKREWSPFVLTPDFVYVMGGENSEMFETYKNLCCRAFLTLRRNADLIISLFSLMRSTGIPELTCVEDTDYIRNVLEMDLTSEHVAEMRFRKVIQKCLNLKWTVQIMWWLHIAKHGSE